MIKLVPIDAVQASEYNPRRNDEKRLALTELSLRKLGFLLPIYADESGEILSGHQRHLVASRMGFRQIPVEYVSGKTLGERRAVNVLFNRATNDLQKQDTCAIIRRRLYEMDIEAMTGELPDIEPGSEASFPCVYALRRMDVVKLAKLNHRSFDTHIKQLAKSLERRIGSAMPVVIGEAGNVINGIGRLQVAAEAGRKVIACVKVRPEQEAFASSMLNLLSMDFDMESTYADDLRFNSFMRERNTRETDAEGNAALGDGFFKGVFPKNCGRDFCKLEGTALETWRRHYGSSVVDFGAGKLNNTRTLRKAGIQVSAFEPYFVTVGEKIHKEKSLEIAARFLDEVEAGTPYSSVFISSVFNSVPFMADRKQIAVIAAALCAPDGMVVCWCQSNNFLLVDNAPAMVEACEKRFQADVNVTVRQGNIWEYLPFEQKSSLVLSVLSMQFMPTSYRPRMLKQIYDGLTDGGALIFVEKILSENMDDLMVDLYYEMKRENGYSDEQIMSKRRSLENVLSPLKAEWSVDMMRTAGFRQVDMFWRCLNFCGWIAVK